MLHLTLKHFTDAPGFSQCSQVKVKAFFIPGRGGGVRREGRALEPYCWGRRVGNSTVGIQTAGGGWLVIAL